MIEQSFPQDEAELARHYEARKGDVSDWERVPGRIRVRRGSPSTVFSLRLAPEELTELYEAAAAQGISVSELIRRAALTAIRQPDPESSERIEKELTSAKEAVERALATLHQ